MRTTTVAKTLLIAASLLACNALRPARPRILPTPPTNAGPTPDPLALPAEYLTGASLGARDTLDRAADWKLESGEGSLVNGAFHLRGTYFWHTDLLFKPPLSEGDGAIVRFRLQNANGQSELVVVSGEWMTDTFRQFGLYNSPRPKADLFQGKTDLGGDLVTGNLQLRPGAWYDLLIAIGRNGHLLAVLWDPLQPAQRAVYDLAGGPAWAARKWSFLPKANVGEMVEIDELSRLTFVDIK